MGQRRMQMNEETYRRTNKRKDICMRSCVNTNIRTFRNILTNDQV